MLETVFIMETRCLGTSWWLVNVISSSVLSDEKHFQRCSYRNSASFAPTDTDNVSFKHWPSWVTSGDVSFDREQSLLARGM